MSNIVILLTNTFHEYLHTKKHINKCGFLVSSMVYLYSQCEPVNKIVFVTGLKYVLYKRRKCCVPICFAYS